MVRLLLVYCSNLLPQMAFLWPSLPQQPRGQLLLVIWTHSSASSFPAPTPGPVFPESSPQSVYHPEFTLFA